MNTNLSELAVGSFTDEPLNEGRFLPNTLHDSIMELIQHSGNWGENRGFQLRDVVQQQLDVTLNHVR